MKKSAQNVDNLALVETDGRLLKHLAMYVCIILLDPFVQIKILCTAIQWIAHTHNKYKISKYTYS
jgi:hypothetical protein